MIGYGNLTLGQKVIWKQRKDIHQMLLKGRQLSGVLGDFFMIYLFIMLKLVK